MGELVKFLPIEDGKYMNTSTGEIMQGIPVYVMAKVKWHEGWFMAIQEAFIALAKDTDFSGRPRRVLDYLMGKLSFENYIYVTQGEIAKELNLDKGDVSKSISLLHRKGVIQKGPKLGRAYAYKLNSNFGWKGKVKNLDEERKKRFKIINNQNLDKNQDKKTINWVEENNKN